MSQKLLLLNAFLLGAAVILPQQNVLAQGDSKEDSQKDLSQELLPVPDQLPEVSLPSETSSALSPGSLANDGMPENTEGNFSVRASTSVTHLIAFGTTNLTVDALVSPEFSLGALLGVGTYRGSGYQESYLLGARTQINLMGTLQGQAFVLDAGLIWWRLQDDRGLNKDSFRAQIVPNVQTRFWTMCYAALGLGADISIAKKAPMRIKGTGHLSLGVYL